MALKLWLPGFFPEQKGQAAQRRPLAVHRRGRASPSRLQQISNLVCPGSASFAWEDRFRPYVRRFRRNPLIVNNHVHGRSDWTKRLRRGIGGAVLVIRADLEQLDLLENCDLIPLDFRPSCVAQPVSISGGFHPLADLASIKVGNQPGRVDDHRNQVDADRSRQQQVVWAAPRKLHADFCIPAVAHRHGLGPICLHGTLDAEATQGCGRPVAFRLPARPRPG